MSKEIYNKNGLVLTAFVGRNGDASIQLNIEGPEEENHLRLSEQEIRELIEVMQKRIYRIEGYRATD